MPASVESPLKWRPIALGLAVVAVMLGLLRLLPDDVKPLHLIPVGGLALFAGARLRGWQSFAFPLGLMLTTDLVIFLAYGYPPFDPFVYTSYLVYILMGARFLRQTENPLRIGGALLFANGLFFVLTNFGAWLMKALPYPNSFDGLMQAYQAGLPFHRPLLVSDIVFTAALFGAFALLSRTADSPERIRPREVLA